MIKVLYFCRSPVSYALSSASQRVKGCGFAWDPIPIQPIKEQLTNLSCIYGKEEMIVQKYPPAPNGDIVSFVQMLLNIGEVKLIVDNAAYSNEKLSHEAFNIGFDAIKILDGRLHWKVFNKEVVPVLECIKGEGFSVSGAIVEEIKSLSFENLCFLRDEFCLDFSDVDEKFSSSRNLSDSSATNIDSKALLDALVPIYGVTNYTLGDVVVHWDAPPTKMTNLIQGSVLNFHVSFSVCRDIENMSVVFSICDAKKNIIFDLTDTMLGVGPNKPMGDYSIKFCIKKDLPIGFYFAGVRFIENGESFTNTLADYSYLLTLNIEKLNFNFDDSVDLRLRDNVLEVINGKDFFACTLISEVLSK